MAKSDEVLRNIYSDSEKSIKIYGSVSSGGVTQQITSSQDLSFSGLSYTTSIGQNFIVNGVYFNFSSTVTQTVSLEYNGVVLDSRESTSANNAYFDMGGFKILGSLGKELTVKCTNNGTPSITVDIVIDIEVV